MYRACGKREFTRDSDVVMGMTNWGREAEQEGEGWGMGMQTTWKAVSST